MSNNHVVCPHLLPYLPIVRDVCRRIQSSRRHYTGYRAGCWIIDCKLCEACAPVSEANAPVSEADMLFSTGVFQL